MKTILNTHTHWLFKVALVLAFFFGITSYSFAQGGEAIIGNKSDCPLSVVVKLCDGSGAQLMVPPNTEKTFFLINRLL